jgi:hypothetical protein
MVQSFIRQDANLQKLNAFFKGDGAGRMFVFFQSEVSEGEVCRKRILKIKIKI